MGEEARIIKYQKLRLFSFIRTPTPNKAHSLYTTRPIPIYLSFIQGCRKGGFFPRWRVGERMSLISLADFLLPKLISAFSLHRLTRINLRNLAHLLYSDSFPLSTNTFSSIKEQLSKIEFKIIICLVFCYFKKMAKTVFDIIFFFKFLFVFSF